MKKQPSDPASSASLSTPNSASPAPAKPAREIPAEEAREKRRRFLAQTRQWEAEAQRAKDKSGEDTDDATTATFILPGD